MDKTKSLEILIDFQRYRRWEWEYSEGWVMPKYSPSEIWQALDFIINLVGEWSQ